VAALHRVLEIIGPNRKAFRRFKIEITKDGTWNIKNLCRGSDEVQNWRLRSQNRLGVGRRGASLQKRDRVGPHFQILMGTLSTAARHDRWLTLKKGGDPNREPQPRFR